MWHPLENHIRILHRNACKVVKFSLLSPHIHLEGNVSQIFYLSLSFDFMSKNGKHFLKCLNIIFEVA